MFFQPFFSPRRTLKKNRSATIGFSHFCFFFARRPVRECDFFSLTTPLQREWPFWDVFCFCDTPRARIVFFVFRHFRLSKIVTGALVLSTFANFCADVCSENAYFLFLRHLCGESASFGVWLVWALPSNFNSFIFPMDFWSFLKWTISNALLI